LLHELTYITAAYVMANAIQCRWCHSFTLLGLMYSVLCS